MALTKGGSRFQKSLVESNICLKVDLRWYAQKYTPLFVLDFAADTPRIDDCVSAILQELPKLFGPDYFTVKDFELAVRRWQISEASQREELNAFAKQLAFYWASASLEYLTGISTQVARTSQADLRRFFERYILGRNFVLGITIAPDSVAKGRDSAHFDRLIQRLEIRAPQARVSR
jgi:zinc protease